MSCLQIELTFDGMAPKRYYDALYASATLCFISIEGRFRVYGITATNCNDEGHFQTVVLLRQIQGD